MSNIYKLTILVVTCFFLSSCATGYQKMGWAGGYDETRLQKDIFRVYYKGNAFVSQERVQDYLLLRCAELTIDNGYDYFIILDEKDYIEQSSYTTPTQVSSQSTTYGNANYSGNIYGNSIQGTGTYSAQTDGNATITGGQTHHYSKPRSTYIIKCFKGIELDNLPNAFVAHELIGYLKHKVR